MESSHDKHFFSVFFKSLYFYRIHFQAITIRRLQRKESFSQPFSVTPTEIKFTNRFGGLRGTAYTSPNIFSIKNCFLLAFVFLFSCSAARQVPSDDLVSARPVNPKILFLVFSIEKDSVQKKTSVSLRSKVVKDGEIKQEPKGDELFPNYLSIEYYENNKLKSSFNLEHPLYKNVEYFDGKELVSKYVELNQSDFFIRLRSAGESGIIVIHETKGNGPKTKLLTQKL